MYLPRVPVNNRESVSVNYRLIFGGIFVLIVMTMLFISLMKATCMDTCHFIVSPVSVAVA